MKQAVHIVDAPIKEDVRVMSAKGRQVFPTLIPDTTDPDKYTSIDPDQYERLLEELGKNDTFDVVTFTIRYQNKRVTIVRSFIDGCPNFPVTESVVNESPFGEPLTGDVFVRNDILKSHPVPTPKEDPANIACSYAFLGRLRLFENLKWRHVVEGWERKLDLMDCLNDATDRGVENFILHRQNWTEIKSVYDSYSFGETSVTQLQAAHLVIHHVMKSIVKSVASGVFGADFTQGHEVLVTKASVYGFDSDNIIYFTGENPCEDVYAVLIHTSHNTDKLYLVFGEQNEHDATATFIDQFELEAEDITATSLKKFQFIYKS